MALTTMGTIDRSPPHSEEAERGVLGSILADPERVIDIAIEKQLAPDSFYNPRHRILYEVITDMHHRMEVIDMVTLGEKLQALGHFDEFGGTNFLRALLDSTPTSAHAEHYISIVWDKALLRTIIDRSREAQEKCFNGDEDCELILAETAESFYSLSQNQRDDTSDWSALMEVTVREVNNLFDNHQGLTGIPSGYVDLDNMLMGLQNKDMIILAARPSMGKTSLAMNIVEYVASGEHHPEKTQLPVLVFSCEMGAEQLVRRMLCTNAKVSFPKLVQGMVGQHRHKDIMEAATRLKNLPIVIDDTAGLDVMDLRARARRMASKYGIKLIVIDYLQLLNCGKFAKEGRQRETAAISNHLKAMAKELNVPVIVLSQLSRANEIRGGESQPKLSDLRDSGSIEQDADVVMLLRRPCKYPSSVDFEDKSLAIVDVAKHRNGAVGEIRMNFIEDYTLFQTRDKHHGDEDYH